MSNERVFYQPAGKRRRTTSRILSLLIVVAELGASALPIVDADFPPPGEKPMPYVACVGLIVVFIAGNCYYVAKKGTLPGLTSLGVVAVRMRDGGNAGVFAVQKYAVEAAVTLATLVVGLPFILHFTSDRFGRTWFDRIGGIIYVDTRRPIEDDDEFGVPSAASAQLAQSAGSPMAAPLQGSPSGMSAAEPPADPYAQAPGLVGPGFSRVVDQRQAPPAAYGQSAYSAPEAAYGQSAYSAPEAAYGQSAYSAPEAAYGQSAYSAPEAAYGQSAYSAPEAAYGQSAYSAPEAAYDPRYGAPAESAPSVAGADYSAPGYPAPGHPAPETSQFAPQNQPPDPEEGRASRRARSNRAQAQARIAEQLDEYGISPAAEASPPALDSPSRQSRSARSPRHAVSPPVVGSAAEAPGPAGQGGRDETRIIERVTGSREPATVRLMFDDGVTHVLRGTVVLGRNPVVDPSWPSAVPMPVADLQKSVSKTHVALTLMPGGVRVDDLRSTNGTIVVSPDGQPVPVQPNHPVLATDGASVVFGGRRVRVTFQ